MLIPDYYTIVSRHTTPEGEVFCVNLHADSSVYKGHFPSFPVSPGVCNIEMLKECAELVAGKSLLLTEIKSCKLTTLVTPVQYPMAEVCINITKEGEVYSLSATLGKGTETYLTLKGCLKE